MAAGDSFGFLVCLLLVLLFPSLFVFLLTLPLEFCAVSASEETGTGPSPVCWPALASWLVEGSIKLMATTTASVPTANTCPMRRGTGVRFRQGCRMARILCSTPLRPAMATADRSGLGPRRVSDATSTRGPARRGYVPLAIGHGRLGVGWPDEGIQPSEAL